MRPTSDRLKEALFNLLQTRIEGCGFLDCFAGSGSIGIEALSRGAAFAGFVESSSLAVQVIRQNLEVLGLERSSRWQILNESAELALRNLHGTGRKFDIVFLDPPYADAGQYPRILEELQRVELLGEEAVIIAEHSKFVALPEQVLSLEQFRDIRQGDSVMSLFHLRP